MATLTLKYNPRNVAVTKMLNAVTSMKGVERMYPEDELSPEEMIEVEKSLNSGFSTMEELRKNYISAAELQSVEKGYDDFQKGNTKSHLIVKKRYEKWL